MPPPDVGDAVASPRDHVSISHAAREDPRENPRTFRTDSAAEGAAAVATPGRAGARGSDGTVDCARARNGGQGHAAGAHLVGASELLLRLSSNPSVGFQVGSIGDWCQGDRLSARTSTRSREPARDARASCKVDIPCPSATDATSGPAGPNRPRRSAAYRGHRPYILYEILACP